MNKIIKLFLLTIFVIGGMNNALSQSQQVCRNNGGVPSTTFSFVDNLDGTISHQDTGLMWQKCQLGKSGNLCVGNALTYSWIQAIEQAALNNLRGYNDWRLPNIKELESIVELKCQDPSIRISYFPNTTSTDFWTSSPYKENSFYAWKLSFLNGRVDWNGRNVSMNVRLVRSIH